MHFCFTVHWVQTFGAHCSLCSSIFIIDLDLESCLDSFVLASYLDYDHSSFWNLMWDNQTPTQTMLRYIIISPVKFRGSFVSFVCDLEVNQMTRRLSRLLEALTKLALDYGVSILQNFKVMFIVNMLMLEIYMPWRTWCINLKLSDYVVKKTSNIK